MTLQAGVRSRREIGGSRVAIKGLAPKCRAGRVNGCAVIAQAMRAILSQPKRPVQINQIGVLRQQHGGRHRQLGGDHAADHDFAIVGLGGGGAG